MIDRDDVPASQVIVERLFCPPTRGHAAGFADHEPFNPWPAGFWIFAVDSVIPNQRIRHTDELSGIRRIGEHFLITSHGSVKDHLATGFALGRPRSEERR